MKILSEKCEMSQEEVLKRYDEFKNDFPEGEITKDQFLENKVTLTENSDSNDAFLLEFSDGRIFVSSV